MDMKGDIRHDFNGATFPDDHVIVARGFKDGLRNFVLDI